MPERLGKRRLAGADIPGEYEQRRPLAEGRDHRKDDTTVLFLAPGFEQAGVEQESRLLEQPGLGVVQADQAVVPFARRRIRELLDPLEDVRRLDHSGTNRPRLSPMPAAE